MGNADSGHRGRGQVWYQNQWGWMIPTHWIQHHHPIFMSLCFWVTPVAKPLRRSHVPIAKDRISG
jgi:hypothetical protein